MSEYIDITQIKFLSNVRTEIDTKTVTSLMASIKEIGLIEPIIVYLEPQDNIYYLLAGHQRFNALTKLGYTKLKIGEEIIIKENAPDIIEALSINTAENVIRKQLLPIEIGRVIVRMKKLDPSLTNSQIAIKLSLSKLNVESFSHLYRTIPVKFQKHISSLNANESKLGRLSPTVIRSIQNIKNIKLEQKENLMEVAQREEYSSDNISTIRALIEQGISYKNALKYEDNYQSVWLRIPINKTIRAKIEKEHNANIRILIESYLMTGKPEIDLKLFKIGE